MEEENVEVVDEVDPTDRKPVLFDENKGKNPHFQPYKANHSSGKIQGKYFLHVREL